MASDHPAQLEAQGVEDHSEPLPESTARYRLAGRITLRAQLYRQLLPPLVGEDTGGGATRHFTRIPPFPHQADRGKYSRQSSLFDRRLSCCHGEGRSLEAISARLAMVPQKTSPCEPP